MGIQIDEIYFSLMFCDLSLDVLWEVNTFSELNGLTHPFSYHLFSLHIQLGCSTSLFLVGARHFPPCPLCSGSQELYGIFSNEILIPKMIASSTDYHISNHQPLNPCLIINTSKVILVKNDIARDRLEDKWVGSVRILYTLRSISNFLFLCIFSTVSLKC